MAGSQREDNAEDDLTPITNEPPQVEEFAHFNQMQRGEGNYNPRKPKWWVKLCGNTSKAQKRAIQQILQTHGLPRREYGTIIDWTEVMRAPNRDIWIEIGMGRGENLLALAHRKKDENAAFVGIEINKNGMGTACQRVVKGLETNAYFSGYTLYSPSIDPYNPAFEGNGERNEAEIGPTPPDDYDGVGCDNSAAVYENVRLYPGDAVKLFPHIPSSSVAVVLVTFPDPFPRDSDKEWRVVQVATLRQIHRILRKSSSNSPGRFFLATDHEGFFSWSHQVVEQINREFVMFEKVEPCPDRSEWLPAVSRYEQKGWDEGRQTRLSCWAVKG